MGAFDDLMAARGGRLVLDGPLGTELELRGYDVNDALWSAKFLAEDPAAIRQVHRDYLEAGADIVTCASYQASVPGFVKAGYSREEAESLIALSVRLAQEARQEWWESGGRESSRPWPLVAGDIGPYGAYLADGSEYSGGYHLTLGDYIDFHLRRIEVLCEAGADLFAVETMPRLDEALACANMLEGLDCDYWVSFTFRDEGRISDGNPLEEVAQALEGHPHLKALGVNCTPPAYVEGIIAGLRACTDLPICAYPNSGEVYDGATKTWHGSPDGICFADRVPTWVEAGVSLLGGCCRTRPSDIREIATRLHG